MFDRLFARMNKAGKAHKAGHCRPVVELLEDRLVPATATNPAITGVQTQTLANPANTIGRQVIAAGVYQTVASQAVTITAKQTGLVNLSFEAQAFAGATNRLGIRYLIDGNPDPSDAALTVAGTEADAVEDIVGNTWQTLRLYHQLTLTAGTHVISVQILGTTVPLNPGDELSVYTPVLSLTGYNVVDLRPAAVGVQTQLPSSPLTGAPGEQVITAGSFQTVSTATVTVGGSQTGVYDLAFQAQAFTSMKNRALVRYLIDGKPDPADAGLAASPGAADTVEDFYDGFGGGAWHTLFLTHQLNLSAGTHTITVQVECTSHGLLGQDLLVFTPTLGLTGYTVIDGTHAADGVQVQTPAGAQSITAGAWQTVASKQITLNATNTGTFAFGFQAQAFADRGNRVFVRYLIDGRPDPNDVAASLSPNTADATVDFLDSLGTGGTWQTLALTRLLSLPAGTHTIAVQVECTDPGPTPGQDLSVYAPVLHLTSFNAIPQSPYFHLDPGTATLIINGTAGNDQFTFSQSTSIVSGAPVTTYHFSMNGATANYTSAQVHTVVVNGGGGNDAAVLNTNDTYVGSDHKPHETTELAAFGAGGGVLDRVNASGSAVSFLYVNSFAKVTLNMGRADVASLFADPSQANTYTTAGLTATMAGSNYSYQVNGAGAVYGYAASARDRSYQNDGSGASTYTVSGTAFSVMQGTDQRRSFFNEGLGFVYNYGIAHHASQDIAIIYDSPNNDVFVGGTSYSYLYSDDASGNFAMFDAVSGFGKVYAYSFVGGIDVAINHDPTVNILTGFVSPP